MGGPVDISLTHGVVVQAVPLLGAAALAATVFRRTRRWWVATLPRLIAPIAALLAATAWYLHHSGIIPDHYPRSFALWIGEALLALAVAIVGWRNAGRWRRAVSIAAVPLTFASAFVLINSHYAYWPTVGDLLGRPMRDAVSGTSLNDILAARSHERSAAPAGAPADAPAAVPAAPQAPASDDGAASPADGPTSPAKIAVTAPVPTTAAETDPAPAAAADAEPASPAGGESDGQAAHSGPVSRGHRGRPPAKPQEARVAAAEVPSMHGVLAPLDVTPEHSGFSARQGTLYLPPAYFKSPPPDLPVIVMVGGTPGGPQDWPRAGFASETADAYASAHEGVAPILAFVDHNGGVFKDTECVDGPAGQAETFLADDVPHYLARTLHIPLSPPRWAIAGFSEGGTCAFELAVRHPDIYGTFVDIAGDWAPNLGSDENTLRQLYAGDRAAMAAHDPANLLRPNRFHNMNGWFVVGSSDSRHVTIAERLAGAATGAGITTTKKILPGSHNWQLATIAFRAVLGPVGHQLGAEAPPGPNSGSNSGNPNATPAATDPRPRNA